MTAPDFNDSPPEPFSCEVEPERDDAVRLHAVGSLDMATVPLLRTQIDDLRKAGCRRVIVDLRRLDFMDSSGLRLMLTLDAEARQDGFSLGLVPGPVAVQQVFEITGTTERLPFITERPR